MIPVHLPALLRPAFEHSTGSSGATPLSVGGDCLRPGEPLVHAARREAKEETGVRLGVDQEFCGLTHHHAEPDRNEGLFRVLTERPSRDCRPSTATISHTLTHGPSCRAVDRPAGGAR